MDAVQPEDDSQCRTWLVVPGGGRLRDWYRGDPEPASYNLSRPAHRRAVTAARP